MQASSKKSHCKMSHFVGSDGHQSLNQLDENNSLDQRIEQVPPRTVIINVSEPWEDCYLFKQNCFNSHYLDPRSPLGFDILIRTHGFVRYFLKKLTDFTGQHYDLYNLPMLTNSSSLLSWLVTGDEPVAFVKNQSRGDQAFFIDFRRVFDFNSADLYWSYLEQHHLTRSYRFNAVILADSFPNLETTGPITFTKFNSATKSFTYLDPIKDGHVHQRFLLIDVNKFPNNDQDSFLIWCKAICDPNIFLDKEIQSQVVRGLQVLFVEMQHALHVANCWQYLISEQEDVALTEVRLANTMKQLYDCYIKRIKLPHVIHNYDPRF